MIRVRLTGETGSLSATSLAASLMPEFTIGIDTDTALDTITEDLVPKYAIGAVDDSAAAMNKYELASAAGSNGISSLFAAAYPVLETMLHGNVLSTEFGSRRWPLSAVGR